MGKDLKGRELGKGLYQQQDGLYRAYFVDKFGKRQTKRSKKLQELRQWLSDAIYYDEHSDLENVHDIIVDSWFDYCIEIKQETVRPNTVRNYTERYNQNIKKVIGKKLISEVTPICRRMACW